MTNEELDIKMGELISAIRQQIVLAEPKEFTMMVHPVVFKRLIDDMKRRFKRAWREQRNVNISKSDWLADKGLRKEWQ